MARATATFTLDTFEQDPPHDEAEGVAASRVRITKTFHGDLEATSTVEMLAVEGVGGRAYVALELVTGTLAGRHGAFSLVHLGRMVGDEVVEGRWPIVEGSGTGSLEGIRGECRIDVAPGGAHTLSLDYELGGDPTP